MSSYGSEIRDGLGDHYVAPVDSSVAIGSSGHVSSVSSTAPLPFDAPYDPSRIYHQMGPVYNNVNQSYPRYPAVYNHRGIENKNAGGPPSNTTEQPYYVPHPQHVRPQQQQHQIQQTNPTIGSPEASHLYRPASPMISAMAPQHGSPPLSYSKPMHSTNGNSESTSPRPSHSVYQQHGAGHPSFQAQHHRQVTGGQQQQQHIGAHQQYPHNLLQHSISHANPAESCPVSTPNIPAVYNNPAHANENYNHADLSYQTQSPVMYPSRCSNINNNSMSSNYNNQVCHPQLDSCSQQPVIADLDQLQQQQRQHTQQHCSGQSIQSKQHTAGPTGVENQRNLHPHSIQHPLIQHPSPLVESGNPHSAPSEQSQPICPPNIRHSMHPNIIIGSSASGQQSLDDHHSAMEHHLNDELRLHQHSPIDGSQTQLPPLMDGESPPGSLQDSPLYPWMRSQFGNYLFAIVSSQSLSIVYIYFTLV